MTPYFPGSEVVPQWSKEQYNPWEAALWAALDDVYHAAAFAFAETRQPSPGFVVDAERFSAWQQRVIERWEYEAHRDNATRGLTRADLPENAWLYMYERMLAADALRPSTPPVDTFRFYIGSWVGTAIGAGTIVSRTSCPGEPNTYGVKMGGQVFQFTEGELGYLDDD